jgi:SAM-dependent methyltransferase
MHVLDVGCGSGAIAAGIARVVGPGGLVVGIDRDEDLIGKARGQFGELSNLRFQRGDASDMRFHQEFHVVTAARTLQWIAEPARVLDRMREATVSGGLIVVLDYNHVRNRWQPDPPDSFREFYRSFLEWRSAHGWDNELADKLEALLCGCGLQEVEAFDESEVVTRGDANFSDASRLWAYVVETLGPAVVAEGYLAEGTRAAAEREMEVWCRTRLVRQTLALRAARGRVA